MTDFEKSRTPDEQPESAYPPAPGASTAPGSTASSTTADTGTDGAAPDGPVPGDATETDRPAPAGFDERGRVKRGRVSTLWISLVAVAVGLILLIIFIAQNLHKASVHFLGFDGRLATGLVVLIAAVIGVLIAAIPGTIRILQLRKSLKRNTPKGERTSRQA